MGKRFMRKDCRGMDRPGEWYNRKSSTVEMLMIPQHGTI